MIAGFPELRLDPVSCAPPAHDRESKKMAFFSAVPQQEKNAYTSFMGMKYFGVFIRFG
ncbi:MAG TPA: hypothetical protein PK360_11095 [bacterium]|nr:hypothetical protein [bacterium]